MMASNWDLCFIGTAGSIKNNIAKQHVKSKLDKKTTIMTEEEEKSLRDNQVSSP